MVKKSGGLHGVKREVIKIKKKGVHAKTKQSKNKNSKNYVKVYVGQGR